MLKNIFTTGGHSLGWVKSGSVSATQAPPSPSARVKRHLALPFTFFSETFLSDHIKPKEY